MVLRHTGDCRADALDHWAGERERHVGNSVSAHYVPAGVVGYEDLDANGRWAYLGNAWRGGGAGPPATTRTCNRCRGTQSPTQGPRSGSRSHRAARTSEV
jgi:hypothetical protein